MQVLVRTFVAALRETAVLSSRAPQFCLCVRQRSPPLSCEQSSCVLQCTDCAAVPFARVYLCRRLGPRSIEALKVPVGVDLCGRNRPQGYLSCCLTMFSQSLNGHGEPASSAIPFTHPNGQTSIACNSSASAGISPCTKSISGGLHTTKNLCSAMDHCCAISWPRKSNNVDAFCRLARTILISSQ